MQAANAEAGANTIFVMELEINAPLSMPVRNGTRGWRRLVPRVRSSSLPILRRGRGFEQEFPDGTILSVSRDAKPKKSARGIPAPCGRHGAHRARD